jgi:hypothetical protein
MRRWWIGPVATSAVILACSGGSSDAPIGDGDAGEGGSSSGSSGSSSGSSGGPDAATCMAQGPYAPKVVTSVPRGAGTIAWTSTDNAKEPDQKFASADLKNADSTEELHVTDFGFDIPPDAIVTGIEVELKRIAPAKGVTDGFVFLLLDGQQSPNSHYYDADWPDTIVGTHKYGTELDLWGMTLTPADVAKPTFGATIYAKSRDGGGLADIDALRVIVNYCPPH